MTGHAVLSSRACGHHALARERSLALPCRPRRYSDSRLFSIRNREIWPYTMPIFIMIYSSLIEAPGRGRAANLISSFCQKSCFRAPALASLPPASLAATARFHSRQKHREYFITSFCRKALWAAVLRATALWPRDKGGSPSIRLFSAACEPPPAPFPQPRFLIALASRV
jgi:hypothetical protein